MHWFARIVLLLLALNTPLLASERPPGPDEILGGLFADVQRARIFADQKTFADCVPRGAPEQILAAYAAEKNRPDFDLRRFVTAHFLVPEEASTAKTTSQSPTLPAGARPAQTFEQHLHGLWRQLERAPDRPIPGSSLLPLPHPYVVPGGRFRELYYWDSYFTMLGLRVSGREDLIQAMVDNFAAELDRYGLIPNGNRTYYLSRSQPPFFALMVELVAEKRGAAAYRKYRTALNQEYAYWMDRSAPTRHVVHLRDGTPLNRYWDQRDTPRPESFRVDEETAKEVPPEGRHRLYRDLRSAAESGWDFSSRWFADGTSLASIETTLVVPVDLNALLCQLERTLAKASDGAEQAAFTEAAERRAEALRRACWSETQQFFVDHDLRRGGPREALTLAGVVPLFLRLATPEQAAAVARTLETKFLRPGGLVTTLRHTGEQWDAPNGWAPLQWMAIRGLRNYGHDALADEIAQRWLRLNRAVYERTGRMMEKYNVEDLSLPAGGGEYPTQDGFGWTNGVALALRGEGRG